MNENKDEIIIELPKESENDSVKVNPAPPIINENGERVFKPSNRYKGNAYSKGSSLLYFFLSLACYGGGIGLGVFTLKLILDHSGGLEVFAFLIIGIIVALFSISLIIAGGVLSLFCWLANRKWYTLAYFILSIFAVIGSSLFLLISSAD